MNDYLTAIAVAELTRNHPTAAWTYRPHPRRRTRSVVPRLAALVRGAAPRRPAAALS
jgi:hypothetical protein